MQNEGRAFEGSFSQVRSRRLVALTLAEIVLAVGLLAVAALSLVALFTAGLRLLGRSEQVATATSAARQLLERCRALDPSLIPRNGTFNGRDGQPAVNGFPPYPYPSTELAGGHYALVVQTEEPGPRLISVTVEVWHASSRLSVLQTYIKTP